MNSSPERDRESGDISQRELHEVLESCPDAIALINDRGTVTYENAAFKNLGLGEVSNVSRLVESLGPGATKLENALQSMKSDAQGFAEFDFSRGLDSGQHQLFRVQIKRMTAGVSIFLRDITEVHLERRIRNEAERRLHHFVNQAPLGVIEWNIRFECTAWSPMAEKIFGYTAEQAIGRHFTELISHGMVREIVDGYWQELVRKGLPTRNINENVDNKGNVLLCEWLNLPYFDIEGKFVGVWSICNDLTERRRNEQMMMETALALEQKVQEAALESAEKDRLIRELDAKFEIITQQTAEITRLSSPILELWEGVIAVPIIGNLDETRSSFVMEQLLAAVVEKRSEFVLLDMTGVDTLAGESTERLANILRAVELLGARGILTGVQPAVARTIVEIGASFGMTMPCRNLRDGLRIALATEKRRRKSK
jgi:PAS domain S-box-containing protein